MTVQLTGPTDRDNELSMMGVYTPRYVEDPYPLYRRAREINPVLWDPTMGDGGAWMVTGYEPALTTLRDSVFSARRPQWDPDTHSPEQAAPLRALYSQLFVTDAPDHKRLRKLMTKPFLPRAVEAMRDGIERGARALLDAVLPRGGMDFMTDYAMALPSAVVCGVLGVPVEERELFWKRILSWGLLVDEGPLSKEHPGYHLASVGKYMDFFREQLRRRESERTDDLMQTLADAWADGGFTSEEELLGNLIFMLTAGQTTTAHQIGNSVLALLDHPDVLARLTADPSLVPYATPELMRYDSSVQLTKRRPVRDVELGGQTIRAGEEIYVWMGAAHRDPKAFPDPDRLDVDRPRSQNLALGHGAHYCLGGQLGQLINEVAVRQFVERVRRPEVDRDKIHRTETPTFRGPHSMPMTFTS
ncbi:cytochrome P450 [Streptomyces sp. SHP 1-2]|uniref:cytochrome P450 n=1 Tax=Streptomyces sp. SHP 1-2 TaxID=2769489 RepID=UPI002238FACA|nr:cytochrome P450 [Streptomyces sp. SHP 1-2]MCW5251221.1 cytochrome P450 [Streptomyces sp. SHP 1-2]